MGFGILAMVIVGCSWTLCGYIMDKAPKKHIYVPRLLFFGAVIAFVFSIIYGVITLNEVPTSKGLIISFVALCVCGFVNYFQLSLMSKAMQQGPSGIIWSIVQAGFIFPFFMGIIFFNVKLSWIMSIGFLSVITSLVLFGLTKSEKGKGKWKLLVFTAFLATGIGQCLSNLPSYFTEYGVISSAFRTAFWSLGLMAGSVFVHLKELKSFIISLKNDAKRIEIWQYACILQLFELIMSLCLLYRGMDALSQAGKGSIAYPIMVCSCLICFEIIALTILREKRTLLQIIALLLCLAGVVALCY